MINRKNNKKTNGQCELCQRYVTDVKDIKRENKQETLIKCIYVKYKYIHLCLL